DEAEAAFNDAYDAIPNTIVLLGIAEVQERAGRGAASVATLERYLRERSDAPDRNEVTARIERIRAMPATVSVSSAPDGATISVNGEPRSEVTPAELSLDPGEYEIGIALEGYEPAVETVTGEFGTRSDVSVELTEATSDDPLGENGEGDEYEEEEDYGDDSESEGGVPAGVWVASGVAAAALVAGTVLGFMALSEQADFDDDPSEDTADNGETLALFADVGFGIAGAAALTAIVLYLTTGDDEDESDEAGLQLAPVVGPRAAGVAAQLEF
ncbi:MAG: PEGA domain-containing protein, partial [Myxococcota bacterium]